jgi:hypothetical protein
MAKDKKKKGGGKKDGRGGPGDAVEAVRTAVERTFMATAEGAQITRDRAQELVDEITSAANRVREALEELDLVEELRGLRSDVEKLARRVTALEPSGGGEATAAGGADVADAPPAPKAASRKPSAKRAAAKAAKASKPAGKKPGKVSGKASGGTATVTPPGVEVPDAAAAAALASRRRAPEAPSRRRPPARVRARVPRPAGARRRSRPRPPASRRRRDRRRAPAGPRRRNRPSRPEGRR